MFWSQWYASKSLTLGKPWSAVSIILAGATQGFFLAAAHLIVSSIQAFKAGCWSLWEPALALDNKMQVLLRLDKAALCQAFTDKGGHGV